jgi:hypothetical protein
VTIFFPVQHQHCSIAFNKTPPCFFIKTMSSPTTNEAAVAPMTINKITGQPTSFNVNLLKQKIAEIVALVKTTSWGGRHGHLVLILNDDKYCLITSKSDTHDYTPQHSTHHAHSACQHYSHPLCTYHG